MLHHPEYRERYAANLKRELPRIPFVKGTESAERATIVAQGVSPGSAVVNDSESLQGRHILTADALRQAQGRLSTPPAAGSARDDSAGKDRGPSTPAAEIAASAQDDSDKGRAGLQASVKSTASAPSSLPKASAKPLAAERHKETAGPSTRAKALARDDKKGSMPERGPEGPHYPDDKAVFWAFVEVGRNLANFHVNYEQQPEYPLERVEKGQLNWRVEKMRLGKDKTSLIYNEFLTLRGIPPETYEYRLGNRSALEWVIDQYQVSTDKRSGITNDPNRADDPEYIVRLIGQVITVSLETMKQVKGLPPLAI